MKIGILAGSVVPKGILSNSKALKNRWGMTSGPVNTIETGENDLLVIQRHGNPPRFPPHMVNHRANIQALKDNDVDIVISICSTGALRDDIEVPCISIPSDYIDLFSGATFHDNDIHHATPGLDRSIQNSLAEACRKAGTEPFIGTTYVQTRGPRLETKAEVRLLSRWGDLVGMNLGPEATLCSESGIRCGSILTVDNHANGLSGGVLDFHDILDSASGRWSTLMTILQELPGEISSME